MAQDATIAAGRGGFAIAPTGAAALRTNFFDRAVAITPDGTRLIYVGNNGRQLFVHPLGALEPKAISIGNELRGVFVSPDSTWVGFVDSTSILKKVAATGGPAVTVAQMDGSSRGATWASDDTILFCRSVTGDRSAARLRCRGRDQVLTKPDRERGEGDHPWPEFVPGRDAVLFTITPASGSVENGQIAVLDLQSGISKVLAMNCHLWR